MGGRGSSSGRSAVPGSGSGQVQQESAKKIEVVPKRETYRWRTEKGAQVEVDVEWKRETHTGDWGEKTETGRIDMYVKSFRVNGKEVSNPRISEAKHPYMITGYIGSQQIGTPVPKSVEDKMYKEERERDTRIREREDRLAEWEAERRRQEEIHAGGERIS